jgi:hypothetical protein
MARPLRIDYPGAFYHVINRGQSRRDIFLEDKGRQTFLDLLAEIARLWKIEIHAYCLMGSLPSTGVDPGGGTVAGDAPSRVSSAFVRMKSRVAQEKSLLGEYEGLRRLYY